MKRNKIAWKMWYMCRSNLFVVANTRRDAKQLFEDYMFRNVCYDDYRTLTLPGSLKRRQAIGTTLSLKGRMSGFDQILLLFNWRSSLKFLVLRPVTSYTTFQKSLEMGRLNCSLSVRLAVN